MLRWLVLPWLAYNVYVAGLYVYDKRQARRAGRRVPERTLLLYAAAFGAPGALAGMRLARHKTRKWPFAIGVPLILAMQVLLIVSLLRHAA